MRSWKLCLGVLPMDKVRLQKIKQIKEDSQGKTKGKEFKNLSAKEKDALLETMAKMLGLIE